MTCDVRTNVFKFFPGEDKRLTFHIQTGGVPLPLDPYVGGIPRAVKISLPGIAAPVSATIESAPLGRCYYDLSAAQTTLMKSGSIVVDLIDQNGKTRTGLGAGKIERTERSGF